MPSMPSSNSTKAPLKRHVEIWPFTRLPMVNFFSISSTDLGSSWRKPNGNFLLPPCSHSPRTTASSYWHEGEDVRRTTDALRPGKFGDVNEAFDTFFPIPQNAP